MIKTGLPLRLALGGLAVVLAPGLALSRAVAAPAAAPPPAALAASVAAAWAVAAWAATAVATAARSSGGSSVPGVQISGIQSGQSAAAVEDSLSRTEVVEKIPLMCTHLLTGRDH